jgi:predicted small lipoprotein YifL|tara:strand:- start:19 stop:171 length:153 start_codon:yes stop_codon:yes gene_type:complete
MKIYTVIYLLFISILLNSCGTKGPLYIPEEKYPQAELLQNMILGQESRLV